jgi:hypothetical protein
MDDQPVVKKGGVIAEAGSIIMAELSQPVIQGLILILSSGGGSKMGHLFAVT